MGIVMTYKFVNIYFPSLAFKKIQPFGTEQFKIGKRHTGNHAANVVLCGQVLNTFPLEAGRCFYSILL